MKVLSSEHTTTREIRVGDHWGTETTTHTVTKNPDGSITTVSCTTNDVKGCPICGEYSCGAGGGCFGS